MTNRDKKDIQSLYYIHRFIPSSIARLYGLSHQRILKLLGNDTTVVSDISCMLCGLEDSITYHIDGDSKNQKPQNIINLCEADKRRVQHLQLRRRKILVTPQS